MVVMEQFKREETYRCEVCGFHYEAKGDAEACEEGCEEGICRNDVTAKALERRA
ncbi:MAG: hypothetical protein MAG715_00740 [Methanonatronarchaeales archaeon]|nr:hypothetical protein [Methanonatronarchaeales archaeon]